MVGRSRRVFLALLAGAALLLLARSYAPSIAKLIAFIRGLGPLGPIVFILVYIVAAVALIPASWFTIAGGAMFGLLPGVFYGLIGATLGSATAFLVGRYLARDAVARRLDAMPRFAAIDRAIAADALRIILLLRLSPVMPFNFLNYALGLTAVSLRDFLIGSAGMVPGAFMYAYAGSVAGQALAVAGQAAVPRNSSYYAVLTAGLAATIAASALVTRAARRALRDV